MQHLQVWDEGYQAFLTVNSRTDAAELEGFLVGWRGTAFPTEQMRIIDDAHLEQERAAMTWSEPAPIEEAFAPLPGKREKRRRVAEPAW